MQDSAYGSSHGAFLQKPLVDGDEEVVPTRRIQKSCKFGTDFGPRMWWMRRRCDQLHDELPQPYRYVNQLINQLIRDATDKTFVDDGDNTLATGRLDWRVPEAEQATELPVDKVMRPVGALPLGQLACWAAVQGTPFRIAVDQVGTMIAYQMRPDGAREVGKRATEAVVLDHTATPPASILCCGRGPLGAVAVVYTAQQATVFALGIQALDDDDTPSDDERDPPEFDEIAARIVFDNPPCSMTMKEGLLASVHGDHARVYQLRSPPRFLNPWKRKTDSKTGSLPIWLRTRPSRLTEQRTALNFIQAHSRSVTGGRSQTLWDCFCIGRCTDAAAL